MAFNREIISKSQKTIVLYSDWIAFRKIRTNIDLGIRGNYKTKNQVLSGEIEGTMNI